MQQSKECENNQSREKYRERIQQNRRKNKVMKHDAVTGGGSRKSSMDTFSLASGEGDHPNVNEKVFFKISFRYIEYVSSTF
jgi:hypothetical protein